MLDSDGEYASLNTNCFYAPKNGISLEFIAAFCSSKVFMFLYRQLFGALRMSGGYFQFQSPQLRAIPIRQPPRDQQDFVKVVRDLTAAMKSRPRDAGTTATLFAKLNHLIYRLYDLTDAEIAALDSPE